MSATELPGIAHMADEQKQAEITSDHLYHAQATLLQARLKHPVEERIHPRGHVKLPADGNYDFKHADPYRLDGVISYRSGYTQVAGHPSSKKDGFATLTTSVLEGINVLDVLTADRVVAQISTVHPKFETGKQVPSVSFLGTRFEGLRIGGHEIKVKPAPAIFRSRKQNDPSFFDDDDIVKAVEAQHAKMAGLTPIVPQELQEQQDPLKDGDKVMTCWLVDSATSVEEGLGPFGHVIDVPHFGRIFLGELIIHCYAGKPSDNPRERVNDRYRFNLTMIRLEMGCVGTGTASLVMADSNGSGSKGSP